MELVKAYKKEVRLAYAARQLPYVGTLLTKKVKDSEGAEVGLKISVKIQIIGSGTKCNSGI